MVGSYGAPSGLTEPLHPAKLGLIWWPPMTSSPIPPPPFAATPFAGAPFPAAPFPTVPLPAAPPASPSVGPFGPLPENLEGIVRLANERGVSDVHLGVGEEPRYRSRGDMLRTEWPVTDQVTFNRWVREMLSPAEVDQFNRDKEFDGSFTFPFVRVRINLMDSFRGPAMVLRLIPQKISTLDELSTAGSLSSSNVEIFCGISRSTIAGPRKESIRLIRTRTNGKVKEPSNSLSRLNWSTSAGLSISLTQRLKVT